MRNTLFFLLLFITSLTTSQNLVLNPSFEAFEKCPWNLGMFNGNVHYWSCPNQGSTDFFRHCGFSEISYENYNGEQKPFSGEAYAGMYCYATKDYREYVQGQLKEKLLKGEVYEIVFYISLAEKSSFSIKDMSFLFTEKRIGMSEKRASLLTNPEASQGLNILITEKFIDTDVLKMKNQILNKKESTAFYDNTKEWMKVTFEYKAEGFEKFFTIGNFKSNAATEKKQILSDFKHEFAYYYIDDISVKAKQKSFETEIIYTFKNVLFDFDKAELLEVSVEELDKLYEYLIQNPNLNIEIYGHTDIIGLDARNEELSLQRAEAVANYLISKGIEESRIKFFGFSSSRPVDSNKTEQGRSQNRRVEFKLLNS